MAADLASLKRAAMQKFGDLWLPKWVRALEQIAARDLCAYGAYVHGEEAPILAQAAEARHVRALVSTMEQHKQTLFVTPPEHFKSTLMQWHIEQWLGQETEKHFADRDYPAPSALLVMNAAGQAEKLCMLIAATLEGNERYQRLYPHVRPHKQWGWTKDTLFLGRRAARKDPSLFACGMFGPIQGFRFGLEVMDDPIDQQDANSDNLVKKQIDWTVGVFDDRLIEGGLKRFVMTLWGQKGIAQSAMKSSSYRSLVLPCYGQSEQWGARLFPESYPEYPWGRELWPEVWPMARLEKKREEKQMAEAGDLWQLAYLCDPTPTTGNLFKRDLIQYAPSPILAIESARAA